MQSFMIGQLFRRESIGSLVSRAEIALQILEIIATSDFVEEVAVPANFAFCKPNFDSPINWHNRKQTNLFLLY